MVRMKKRMGRDLAVVEVVEVDLEVEIIVEEEVGGEEDREVVVVEEEEGGEEVDKRYIYIITNNVKLYKSKDLKQTHGTHNWSYSTESDPKEVHHWRYSIVSYYKEVHHCVIP